MQRAIDETNRRRRVQMEYNETHGITPQTIVKAVREVVRAEKVAENRAEYTVRPSLPENATPEDIRGVIAELEKEMKAAAKALEFERAAEIRDEIYRLKQLLPPLPHKR
jgi:excinuclease ABC subunit B